MIETLVEGIRLNIEAFAASVYGGTPDDTGTMTVYWDEEFDPKDEATYKHALKNRNHSAVIYNVSAVPEKESPYSHVKLRLSADVAFIDKSGNQWDAVAHENRILAGTSGANARDSLAGVSFYYAQYLRTHSLLNIAGDELTFWQDIQAVDAPINVGDFVVIVLHGEFLSMQPRSNLDNLMIASTQLFTGEFTDLIRTYTVDQPYYSSALLTEHYDHLIIYLEGGAGENGVITFQCSYDGTTWFDNSLLAIPFTLDAVTGRSVVLLPHPSVPDVPVGKYSRIEINFATNPMTITAVVVEAKS